jgi:hypothetical protein
MNNSIILWMGVSSLIVLIGISWILIRLYKSRLSRIDGELHAITVMLSQMPKETSLQEYMFTQDQRLRTIEEKLDTPTEPDMHEWHLQENSQQLHTIISMLEDDRKTELTRTDLDNALQTTHDSLKKVLWSLRFDEDKYSDSATANKIKSAESNKERIESIDKFSENEREANDATNTMKSIMNKTDDGYNAMLKYMQRTGKSGINALHALDMAAGVHSR